MNNSNILLSLYIRIRLLFIKYIRKCKFKNPRIFVYFFINYALFFCSLERCKLGEDICILKLKWMKIKVIEEALSCILTIILIELMILKKISNFHMVHLIIIFFLFYCYSHGIDFEDHGYYNIQFFLAIVIPIVVFLFILHKLFKVSNKRDLYIFIFTILIIIFLFWNIATKKIINCDEWPKGLNNTLVDNNKNRYGCQIQFPKLCPYKIGKYFLDINRYFLLDCKNKGFSPKEKLLEVSKSPYINKNTLTIGFPLVNKNESFFTFVNYSYFRNLYFENLVDMNNSTLINLLGDKKPEISVDFSKNINGEMNIHLIKNKSLSDERKKLEGNVTPYSNNIIILYIDSVSRALSIRQLKKTLNFFEKFISYKGNYNPKYPSENFHSFQFFKYHSCKYWTVGNYPPLFYGDYRAPSNKLITSHLKKNGFVTCYASDNCGIDFTAHVHNYSFDDAYDYQSINCDPNYAYPNSKLNCFYGKLNVEYMLDYINQFWRQYKDNRKFSVLLTNFAHESSLEKLKYIDNIIYEYFNNLFNDNLLKDTSIFLLSDHGVGVPSIYYLSSFFKLELVLPMFYLFVNDRKNISYESQYIYLNENQQTFITGFDIYSTIVHLAFGDKFGTNATQNIIKSNNGRSLFTKINQKNRSPKNYSLMIAYACK